MDVKCFAGKGILLHNSKQKPSCRALGSSTHAAVMQCLDHAHIVPVLDHVVGTCSCDGHIAAAAAAVAAAAAAVAAIKR